MHTFALIIFSLIAAFWVFYGLRAAYGATKLLWLADFVPAQDA